MNDFFGKGASKYARDVYKDVHKLVENGDKSFTLGPINSSDIFKDPKRIGFQLARYKFVSKMLSGCNLVLEVGCQEGLGTQIVAKEVGKVIATDYYKRHIEACENGSISSVTNIEFIGHDIIESSVTGVFDAAYALDVLEHIDPKQEHLFIENIIKSLN
jgi:2-polyprenyl-3-methyl-5-hydroxy-6-metoxy-1,4-benzoquinol methylase